VRAGGDCGEGGIDVKQKGSSKMPVKTPSKTIKAKVTGG